MMSSATLDRRPRPFVSSVSALTCPKCLHQFAEHRSLVGGYSNGRERCMICLEEGGPCL
ncbi:MAG: hypothetical protein ACYDFT_00235 [Thermoplasmata archaeon]